MADTQNLRARIEGGPATRWVLATDGGGGATQWFGKNEEELEALAAPLDIATAALRHLGPSLSLGDLQDVLVTFDDGILIAGRSADSGVFAVLASATANAGLLLNQVRRLCAEARTNSTTNQSDERKDEGTR